jgi:hypothetical protein
MTSSSHPISTSTLTSACACYNSGLFDFRKDTVTPSLKIDDKLLSDILSELYPPKSPYEFSVIANMVHSSWSIVPGTEDRKPGANSWFLVSGSWFQEPRTKNQELSTDEVIRLTAGHQAKVEEKPEVRKAGGVATGKSVMPSPDRWPLATPCAARSRSCLLPLPAICAGLTSNSPERPRARKPLITTLGVPA